MNMTATYTSIRANGKYLLDRFNAYYGTLPPLWVIIEYNAQIGLWKYTNTVNEECKYRYFI